MSPTVRERLALARAQLARGEIAQAGQLFDALAVEFPDFADVQHEVGLYRHQVGDLEGAATAFSRAIATNPRYTAAALSLTVTLNDLGRYDEARTVYDRAISTTRATRDCLDPFVAGKIANLFAEIGESFEAAGLPAKAARAYRDALSLGREFPDIRMRLAQVLQELGEMRGALDELAQTVAANPGMHAARVAFGLALYGAGDREKAAVEWREVLRQDPGHRTAALYLRIAAGGSAADPEKPAEPAAARNDSTLIL